MIRGQISICFALTILLGCNEEDNVSLGQPVDLQDASSDIEVVDQDVVDQDMDPAELIVCKYNEKTQDCNGCSEGIRRTEWIATIDENGECAIEYTDNTFVFCYWWADFIPWEHRQWTDQNTIAYRYLENGEVEARALTAPMDAREGHGFINEWISCYDETVQDHPPICDVCVFVGPRPFEE